jgi:murein endopeptidase
MRLTRPTTGTRAAATLALLAGLSASTIAGDGPDSPPFPSPVTDVPATVLPVPELPPIDELVLDLPDADGPAPGEGPEPRAAAAETDGDLDAEALLVTAQRDPAALGPLSIGTPDAGLLVNPVPFPDGALWTVRDPREAWGTEETIAFIVAAIEAVEARHPGSPRVVIGDLSNPSGGRLNRHKSHQAGRDADIGFYYLRGEAGSFFTARKKDLDLPRTWAFVRALIAETDVDRIFVDRSLISVLHAHAVAEGEDQGWLADVFGRSGGKGIIQHERRHKDHFHVRFFNPRAQERGRVAYPVLVETGAAPPPMVKHRVRPGETLGSLARRYGTSVSAIRAANGLRSSRLRAGRSYTIPIRRTPPDTGPVVVPPRRLPPDMLARAAEPEPSAAPEPAPALQR